MPVGLKKYTTSESENSILFPNPNTGSFEIALSNTETKIYKYAIYDLTGKLIEEGAKNLTGKSLKFSSTAIGYKPGIYLLKLNTSSSSRTYKFVVE